MTKTNAVEQYVKLTGERKPTFPLRLSYELTIAARSLNLDAKSDASARNHLYAVSELQHHLTAEAEHHLMHRDKRYPDDVLIKILIEKSDATGISAEFAYAYHRALKTTQ